MLPTSIAYSAWVLAQLGEVSEALSRLREGERLFERHATGRYFTEFGILHALGHGGLVIRRLDEAERLGERAIELYSHHHGWRAHMPHPLRHTANPSHRFNGESCEGH